MRLLLGDLRLRRLSLAVWALSVAALVLMIVAIYPVIRDNTSLNSIYADLSPAAQGLLGGSDLTSPVGYLNTQLLAFFLPAVVLVYAVTRGSASVAGEEEDRTLDLLLAQPVRRRSAYLQKSGAVAAGIGVLTVAGAVPVLALDSAVRLDLPLVDVVAAFFQMGLFCVALAFVAQAVAAAVGRRAAGAAAATAYAAVAYVVYGLAASVPLLGRLEPLSLWRWYLGNDPLRAGFGAREIAFMVAVASVAVVIGSAIFERRDLRS